MQSSNAASTPVRAADFGDDFLWGAATASYQIEGAWDADGKGPSIWDDFAHRGKIKHKHTGDVACDHYHRVKEDVALMKELGLGAYRFSIAWPRLMPDGTLAGGVNQAGLDFYKRLVDELLKAGIQPWATLYHWDLPLALSGKKGGWLNREIADHFADYAALCARELGDKVRDWIVLNEPFVFLFLGYGIGYFPPQKYGPTNFARVSHHAMLAQGRAARALRAEADSKGPRPINLGTTISTLAGMAASDSSRHARALDRQDAFFNRLYVDPVFGRGYPTDSLPFLRRIEKFIKDGDMREVEYPFDFLGINHYSRGVAKSARYIPFLGFRQKKPPKNAERTAMKWEVYPPGLRLVLNKFGEYPEIPALYVTENGAAFPDTLSPDGQVHDEARVRYLRDYIGQALEAKREGAPLKGYFAWSLMDNLEWREGYEKRFGIVYVDHETQQRIIKDSGLWYRDFLKG